MGERQEGWRCGGDGEEIEWNTSEVNIRIVSKEQNELIGNFKMAAGNVIRVSGQIMEYTYILTEIKRELVRFGMDCDWKGIVGGGPVAIHYSGQTVLSPT